MIRQRALKVVMVIVGLLFIATVYPIVKMPQEETLQMMLNIYVTRGVFLLLASRNPSANHSLVAFTAWSSFACQDKRGWIQTCRLTLHLESASENRFRRCCFR
jgi:hypothetical protein